MVARTPERLEQIKRVSALSAMFDVKIEFLATPAAVRARWPINVGDVLGGAWIENDGKVHPLKTTLSLCAGAEKRGARFYERTGVEQVLHEDGKA